MRIGILHEHPEWFLPLFGALNKRGIEYIRIDAASLGWDPTERPTYDLLVNRMSPSAYLRGHAHAIFATGAYLQHVESWDVPVVNGSAQWRLEISKSAQLDLFDALGVPCPRSRVINHASQAVAAADRLRYPIVVKPNIGGSGARIQRFDTLQALDAAAAAGTLDLGIDSTALVQEFLPAAGGSITRLELLDGHLLYAIRITPPADHGFNLCPADICQAPDGTSGDAVPGASAAPSAAVQGMCAVKPSMHIEAAEAPDELVRMARRLARRAGLDVCGIEYLVDARDGRPYFYDVNALSNFVTDAPRIVGFDPFSRFVDYLESRLAALP
jgi:glutathione synthase/RimK-type ligase-like ATP-grasp enzyme